MIKNIKTVTIVGGGSAGWMSASMFVKTFPNWNIQIIESPDYPIVGVGESTLLGIREFLHYLDISSEDQKHMMRETDASYKMSIKFTDFYDKNSGGFHYPFGEPMVYSEDGYLDWMRKKSLNPEIPVTDFVKTHFPSSHLFENNKFAESFYNFSEEKGCSYHFDAVKFGQWLKKYYCIPRGVSVISDTVENILVNADGIEKLLLKSGKEIYSDLYVDCTGFKSYLLNQTLKSEFTSFEDILPNNRAWSLHLPYKEKEKELQGFTNSTAIENGWCWNIPLWSRIGTGYVYNDNYVSPEDAKKEFQNYLMSDKMVIPRNYEDIENLEYKDIKIKVGIHKESFYKNVVAIGLSSGFIEPLESNGLLTVHVFLFKLMKTLLRESVTQFDRDSYNCQTYFFFTNFAKFVSQHYALSIRDDTQYWRDITNKKFDKSLYDDISYNSRPYFDIGYRKFISGRLDDLSGVSFLAVGMNYIPTDRITEKCSHYWKTPENKHNIFSEMDRVKTEWESESTQYQSLYKYLQNNIHKDT